MRNFLRLSGLILFAAAGVLLMAGDQAGRRAPGFALPDPSYEHFYDLQDYRGKVLIIDIMSTTCPHCMLLSTTLESVKQHYGNKVAFLSVVLPPDNQATVAKYVATHHVTVPVVCDMGQMTVSYFNAKPGQGQINVPHLFLIDQQGIIRNDFGYSEQDRTVFEGPGLIKEIDKLLK